jgi:hypothetical protein
MRRASVLSSQLKDNKKALACLEDRLNGGYGQEEGAHMQKEHKTLTAEIETLTTALSAIEQNHPQVNDHGIFSLNRTLSMSPNNPESLERLCTSIAETMTQGLVRRYEKGEFTLEMYNDAHAAINYELQFFNATTAEQFEAQITTAIEQALNQTSSQTSYN